jgi:uncharacterized membrane protein SpoIIM required for sporulation
MKKIFYIILLLLILAFGINIGSNNNQNKSEIIKDKIESFEQNITNNNIQGNNINPNIVNKIAIKCNNLVDQIINKVMKSLVK